MQVNLQSRSTATRQGFLSTVNIAPNSFQDLSERLTGKRKIGGKVEAPIKRTKFPAYFISELAHIVAFTDGLEYNITRVGGYKSLFFSGEGFVCRFTGKGKVWIQTRSAQAFTSWAHFFRPVSSK